MSGQIFHDPTGKRRSLVSRILAAFVLLLVVVFITFAASLVLTPTLPGLQAQFRSFRGLSLPTVAKSQRAKAMDEIRPELKNASRVHTVKHPATNTVALAFLPPWEPTAIDSLRNAQEHLTHLAPVWLSLTNDGKGLDLRDFDLKSNPNNVDAIEIARQNNIRIVPVLSNGHEGFFDPKSVNRLLASPSARTELISKVINFLLENRFQGINIDFEDMDSYGEQNLPNFLVELGNSLHAKNLELSMDVQTSADELDVPLCAKACDYLVLMAYDNSSESGKSGPIAPLKWSVSEVEKFLKRAPADKVVLGVGGYAYDWQIGKDGAKSLSYAEAIAQASGYVDEKPEDAIDFDPDSMNMYYRYADDDDGSKHEVWILDAITAYNQWQSVRSKNLRGLGLWALGTADPSIWTFFDYRKLNENPDPTKLEKVQFLNDIDFTGQGEILTVQARPQVGKRTLEVDEDTNLVTDQEYNNYPLSYRIRKSGYIPKKLVLTFDDGPDPRYTPQILDALNRLKAPGTFFVVGQNCERYPDIVHQIYKDGHEIGSHSFTHPDLGAMHRRQVDLELNATQRVIEYLTGHRTILFRPPYNADSQPETKDQMLPVDWACQLGYIVVGENIDPTDWNPNVTNADGSIRTRTADDISQDVINAVLENQKLKQEGNIILLHDAGGNREETVKALEMFVPKLRKMGFEFVSVGAVVGKTRDQLMPKVEASEATMVGLAGIVFWTLFSFQWLLAFLFIVAIALGISRILFMVPLALHHFRNRGKVVPLVAGTDQKVTVLIAAYNEQETIAATIKSVLKSSYPLLEIIVVNDGSTDKTWDVITELSKEHPVLVPIDKENGGKASALNIGIDQARGDLLFCIDADTQLDSEAIARLVPYFSDLEIGAVAGNVEVGNAHNLWTKWQAIEYRTSQNLDRQAYSVLNAITVVPGAIGMWRKSAIIEAGMYKTDTLAEDMDLTWRIRKLGYRIDTEMKAIAYTEAPDTLVALFKQRFRWAFGTLQCLWKHRSALGKYGWFGRLALPTLWLFQVVFQILAPIMDLKILFALISAYIVYRSPAPASIETAPPAIPDSVLPILILYVVFLAIELISGWIAYRMDRRSAWQLWWLVPQRFIYRQLMYAVILRGLWRAMLGDKQAWGKLKRTGGVKVG